ncbi:hypothetical protein DCCM_0395 [Desulfocucumis palustris]|uniref:Uncharacterized protein n=1 Tax=Desulfocucumis palustris TaxID=1898651 RepID=A0A2L2X8F7_9FIRM|nr:hypothetical protein [Desulfocucumis palustris]GBF32204.1 hypothetical protein DCCM_0395 [Desulfocucumis palustris]
MAGTKMTLKRYESRATYYDTQEIVVDEAYLASHNDLIVRLDYPYVPNLKMLEVYYNGQYLSAGGGYEEIDDRTIRLDIRNPVDGSPITQFYPGDEVFIRTWRTFYASGKDPFDERITRLEGEIKVARQDYPSLNHRLDGELKKVIVFVIPGKVITPGIQKIEIRFPFDGEIVDVYASCSVPGTERTVLQIQKISQNNYDDLSGEPGGWVSVLSTPLMLDRGEKSTLTGNIPAVIGVSEVTLNDHFRVDIVELGPGISDITVEIAVKI